jgi:FkbM family methyltransferase
MRHILTTLLFISVPLMADYKSQAGQDKFIFECFFPNKKDGFFLDIGAHDGMSFSNTYFFEKELGWKGICFEPLPHLFKKLKECRDCVCINACVSSDEGTVPFLHLDSCDEMLSGMCGTYDARQLQIVMNDIACLGGECKVLQLPAVNINKVLKEHQVTHVDFLSLDTEGSELEILKSIDFSQVTIDVITVENNFNEPHVQEFLEARGFMLITRLHVDDVYIRSDFI